MTLYTDAEKLRLMLSPKKTTLRRLKKFVREQSEDQAAKKHDLYKAIEYKTQVVAGTNYFIKFMLIPKLLWPLLVYDICSSTVEAIESKINKYTRKWLGVPPGLSDVAMYCRKAKLKLPKKSILEEYKCGKARLLTMLEESDDPVVKTVQPSLKTGRKWKVTEAVDEAKECLKMKEVIGQTQTDRRGLGSTTAKWWSKTEGKE
ncbi:reverse transcriptase [Plakobranchus ocellatus]|uniref:Reverse transcriptase n=1 Tax=Plakobranchus ocellatus TaxID=259542 RepID=A0AAV3ZW23_9GAST|nr:reverse transcriptase [Plakobranchus ocellatus]